MSNCCIKCTDDGGGADCKICGGAHPDVETCEWCESNETCESSEYISPEKERDTLRTELEQAKADRDEAQTELAKLHDVLSDMPIDIDELLEAYDEQ